MLFLDQSVTFRHGILGWECHVPTWYFFDWSVMFQHCILGSECHVMTRYSWIGVSHPDTIILKEKHIKLMEDTQPQ